MFTGYLLIYNVMYISVSKDVQFYGKLKTLGTTPRQLWHVVIGQVLRLSMIGLPVGCILSAAVSLLIVPVILGNSGIDTGAVISFSPVIYIGAILFTTLTALIGAISPAKKVANISTIEALKYTGEHTGTLRIHSSANGRPYKMACRNIFRNRKRAIVVMVSLFLGIVVFSAIMTVVTSIDIDDYINSEYNYDFSFSAKHTSSYFLSTEFIDIVNELNGIKDLAVTKIGTAELMYSENLDKYVEWISTNNNIPAEDVIQHGAFSFVHGVKSIDPLTLQELNKTLSNPIDTEAFERGEIALINILNTDIADCFTDVSAINMKFESEAEPIQIGIGGVVILPR